MNNPHAEELAAAHALGLLDERELKLLWEEAERDPEMAALIDALAETAALLAYDAPQVPPPPAVRRELMRQLPAHHEPARTVPFVGWLPYAVAACLMGLAVYQSKEIFRLHRQVGAEHARATALAQNNRMAEMQLASLEAKDAAYASAKVMVAWDPQNHNGVVSIQNMPPPPPGHDYQLWVLDPTAPGPISAGLLRMESGDQGFAVPPVRSQGPGFAVSLEPAGGRPSPTGSILFAVAPGQ
jgi:anti-sigma-K factor RskA